MSLRDLYTDSNRTPCYGSEQFNVRAFVGETPSNLTTKVRPKNISGTNSCGTKRYAGADSSSKFHTSVNEKSANISYVLGSGDFKVSSSGTYFVSWHVNIRRTSSSEVSFSLKTDAKAAIIIRSHVDQWQVSGSALIINPTVIRLVNSVGNIVTLDETAVSSATMTIVKIG